MKIEQFSNRQIERAKLLEKAILKIRDEKKNIQSVFKELNLPYKPKTYYDLKKRYEKHGGLLGLISQKYKCGCKVQKSNSEICIFIQEQKQKNSDMAGKEFKKKIHERFEVDLSISQINRVIKKLRIKNIEGRPAHKKEINLSYAGSFILNAAIIETDFVQQLISIQLEAISSSLNKQSVISSGIHEEIGIFSKDKSGKFKKYPLESEEDYTNNGFISNKFRSVKQRVKSRDLSRLSISKVSESILHRKNMTLLSLPIITAHSRFSEINNTLSNELKYFAGYDYKGNTIDKYMREMKYLQSSNIIMNKTGEMWHRIWGEKGSDNIKQVCYYFDGHKKPLWSNYSVKQSQVPMLGRVMGCLEQVYVHTNQGNPIILQTFSGGIYLPDAIKLLHEQLNNIIPQEVSRISVFDGGANSVEFYETFKDNEYFICILDNNQYHQDLSDFTIIASEDFEGNIYIEAEKILKNSKNKKLYKVRTPVYKKPDGNKYTAFVTNIPVNSLNAKEVIQTYYKRWPCQELQFRDMNTGGHLSTNYGYGKTRAINIVVQNKKKYIEDQITVKREKIKELSNKIGDFESDIKQQRFELKNRKKEHQTKIRLIEKRIKEGLEKKDLGIFLKKLNALYTQKEKQQSQIIKNELKSKSLIEKLKWQKKRQEILYNKHQSEYTRIKAKELDYKNDTELDQLLGMYKIAFANLSAYVLREYFSGITLSLEHLINKVFRRPGKMLIQGKRREITIYLNKKDKNMSNLIKNACEIINNRSLIQFNNKKVRLVPQFNNN